MIFPSYLGIISSNRFLTIASYENDFTDLKNESEGDIKRTERITLVTDQANSGIEIKRVHAKSKDKIRGKSGIRIGDAVVMIAPPEDIDRQSNTQTAKNDHISAYGISILDPHHRLNSCHRPIFFSWEIIAA